MRALNFYNTLRFIAHVFQICVFSFKRQKPRLVIVNDCDQSDCVALSKSLSCVWVVKLDFEVFVGVPLVIVFNCNLHQLEVFFYKLHDFVNRVEIFTGLGAVFDLNCANSNSAWFFHLVENFDV